LAGLLEAFLAVLNELGAALRRLELRELAAAKSTKAAL